MYILALDPGDAETAYTVIDVQTFEPIETDILQNLVLLNRLEEIIEKYKIKFVAIEMIKSYGMGVGDHVFETCVWIGRFLEHVVMRDCQAERIARMEEKMHICKMPQARDSNIRRALIDRFARHDKRSGKGTIKNPDFFYGFVDDMWAAYAVGLTFIETKLKDLL